MVKLLLGEAGSGKTKQMIQMANDAVQNTKGEIVYIESNSKHMHQLHRDIRFISTEDFNLTSFSSLYGFLCGMLSENYDIQKIFIDGLDKIIIPVSDIVIEFAAELEKISTKHDLDLIISSSIDDEDVLKALEKYMI